MEFTKESGWGIVTRKQVSEKGSVNEEICDRELEV